MSATTESDLVLAADGVRRKAESMAGPRARWVEEGAFHVGFTGTRLGLSNGQSTALRALVRGLHYGGALALHHGDCIGADGVAAGTAYGLDMVVVVHPGPSGPQSGSWRLRTSALPNETRVLVLPEAGYAERNELIVACADVLVACPRDTPARSPRSGTWQTVRMARRMGRDTFLVWPDGRVEEATAATMIGTG